MGSFNYDCDGQYSMNFDGSDLTGFNEKGAT